MFGAIALCALWRPLALIQFLVCTKWALRWLSKNKQKHIKINGLERFRGTRFGGPISAKSVPMQRGARFQVFRSVPMQRGAHSGARNVTKITVLERGARFGGPQVILRGRLLRHFFARSLQKQIFPDPIWCALSRLQFLTKWFHPKWGSWRKALAMHFRTIAPKAILPNPM